ncbi:hypothetical protein WA026_001153 [Henosepilachna vigintioctopunctata]|uniref:Uncharacterized protein n=1 Tax=Henosepilachna vigintioctopunctata TaxID=420089 RepID=A0AAW1V0S7_9CUCU
MVMFNEEKANVCERLLHQTISITELQKMNNCVLNKVLLQLMGLTFLELKVTLKTRSALSNSCKGNIIRASNLEKIRKTSKSRKNATTKRRKKYSVPLKKIKILDTNEVKKRIDSIQNRTNAKKPAIGNKGPIVLLKDILATQERTSKSDYMKYLGLKAVNVPLSSDMGIKMAVRDNHIVSEKFKHYRIRRCEQYINRNLTVKRDTKVFNGVEKLSLNKRKKCIKKDCKEVSVNVIRLDLNKIKQNMAKRKKHFISKVIKNMQKNAENLHVIISPCEKQIVDLLLKKENLKNNLL